MLCMDGLITDLCRLLGHMYTLLLLTRLHFEILDYQPLRLSFLFNHACLPPGDKGYHNGVSCPDMPHGHAFFPHPIHCLRLGASVLFFTLLRSLTGLSHRPDYRGIVLPCMWHYDHCLDGLVQWLDDGL